MRRVECGELKDHPLLHGGHDESDCCRDNAAVAPAVISDHYDWEDDAAPHAVGKTVICEAHVKGLTWPASGPVVGWPRHLRGKAPRPSGHGGVLSNSLALRRWNCRWRSLPPRLQRKGLTTILGYNPMAMLALHPVRQFAARDGVDRVFAMR